MKPNRKKIGRWIKVIILVYCVLGIAFYYIQEKFLFHPEPLDRSYTYHFDVPFEEVTIPFSKEDTLSMVKFFPKDSVPKGVVLYFHGNRQNINRYAPFAAAFTKNGYEVWMEDYPGFGKSIGKRTEENLYSQALQLYKMAQARYHDDSIVLYGKSLGTGIAAYTASYSKAKRLVLETPYYSIPELFACYAPIYPMSAMSTYKIPLCHYIDGLNMPVTIFHGTGDKVIPYRCASKLKPLLKPSDEFITIEGGNHNNLAGYPLYTKKVDSLLSL